MDNLNDVTTVELDWDSYFKEFESVHGGEPIMHQPTNRLLYRDGWTYSKSDTRGPEWPPPSDPRVLNRLLLDYWIERRTIIRVNYESLKGRIRDLEVFQSERSAPLQQRTVMKDEQGKMSIIRGPVDTTLMKVRLDLLSIALSECNEELTKLRSKQ